MNLVNEINKLKISGFGDIDIKKSLKHSAIMQEYQAIDGLASLRNVFVLIRQLYIKRYSYVFEKSLSKLLFVYSDIFFRNDSLTKFQSVKKMDIKIDILFPKKLKKWVLRKNSENPSIRAMYCWITELIKLKCANQIKLRFFIQLIHIYQFLQMCDKLLTYDYNILTVYYDASPLENALVQRFKSKGITTATLQHGMFINRRAINNANYSGVEIRCFVSDYFLAWNDFTQQQLLEFGVGYKKIPVLGMPKDILKIEEKRYFGTKENIVNNLFGVVLDVPENKIFNENLLSIASEISYKLDIPFVIRFHPNEKDKHIKRYLSIFKQAKRDKCKSVIDYSTHVDFTLVSNSSVIIELYVLKRIAFRKTVLNQEDKFYNYPQNTFNSVEDFFKIYSDKPKIMANVEILHKSFYVDKVFERYTNFFSNYI